MNRKFEKQKALDFLRGRYKETIPAVIITLLINAIIVIPYAIYVFKYDGEENKILNNSVEILFGLITPVFNFALVKTVIDMIRSNTHVNFNTYKENLNYLKIALGNFWWRHLWLLIWELGLNILILIPLKILEYGLYGSTSGFVAFLAIILFLLTISLLIFLLLRLFIKRFLTALIFLFLQKILKTE